MDVTALADHIRADEVVLLGPSLRTGPDLASLIDQDVEMLAPSPRRILLMHGTSPAAREHLRPRAESSLRRHGSVQCFSLPEDTANTETQYVAGCAGLIRAGDIDLVVAIGGGRVIDFAKVCATFRDFDFSVGIDDFEGILRSQHNRIPRRHVPLLVIPTTPGTGSEATPFAVLTGRGNTKLFAISDELRPDKGLVCPPLYTTVPREVTRQALMDGLTHALEALWARRASVTSNTYACKAIEKFAEGMIPFYRNPRDTGLAETVAHAAAYAGLAFASAYTTICHALSFPLAESLHLGHGQCCALTAAQVAQFNMEYETPALYQAVETLGLEAPADLPSYLRQLRSSLGDHSTLSNYGLRPEALGGIVCRADPTMVANNAVQAAWEDLCCILRDAL